MTRSDAKVAIRAAFLDLTGMNLVLSPENSSFNHVGLVAWGSESPEEAAKAILESAKVL